MPFRLTRLGSAFAAAVLAFAGCRSAAPPGAPRPAAAGSYPFESVTFSSVLRWESGGRSISSRYWISPLGLLKEMTDGGKVTFVLRGGGTAYEWVAGTHEGKKGPFAGGPRITGEPDTLEVLRILPEVFKDGNSRFSGFERIDGVRTARYEFRFLDGRLRTVWEGTVWLREDRPFPVKYVNRGFGGHFEIVNSRIVFDPKLPAEFFQPPSDVHFVSADIHRK
ncbi:MAG: hypothetical protein ACRD16_00860 [Thermoanaerobaculia bacterium]